MTEPRQIRFTRVGDLRQCYRIVVAFAPVLLVIATLAFSGCRTGSHGRVASIAPTQTIPVERPPTDSPPLELASNANEEASWVRPASFAEGEDRPNDDSTDTSTIDATITDRPVDPLPDSETERDSSLRDWLSPPVNEQPGQFILTEPVPITVQQSSGDPVPAVGITIETLESLTLASHPSIREQRCRIEIARGRYMQAGMPFNPVFQYQSEEVGNDNASGLHSARLSQQIVTANKLGIARQVQAREVQKQQAQLRITELAVLARVRASFAQALVAQRRSELADSIVRIAEQSVDTVAVLFEAGEVSKVALLQAQVELQQASIAAENAESQYRAGLRSLVAAAGNVTLPQGPLVGDLEMGLVERPWESLLAEIAGISPELSLAGSELERAKWALQLACARVVPNVTVQAGAGYDGATDDTFGVIGVSVPLPIRNRNQGNIRAARADIAAASAAIERTHLDLQGRLAGAVGRYEVARQRFTRLTETVLPNAQETYQLSRQAFESGEADFLQLLTAQRTLFDTRGAILDAIATASQTAAEIDAMVVRLDF